MKAGKLAIQPWLSSPYNISWWTFRLPWLDNYNDPILHIETCIITVEYDNFWTKLGKSDHSVQCK